MIKLKQCYAGWGWFATRYIPPYTLILREEYLQRKNMSMYEPGDADTFARVHALCHDPDAKCVTQSVYRKNAFGPGGHSVIYEKASRFNHRCLSNCYYCISVNGLVMFVVSMTGIQEGEELTLNYFGDFSIESISRKERLLRSWGITCQCELCNDYKDIYDTLLHRTRQLRASSKIPGVTEKEVRGCIKDINDIAKLLHLPETHCILQEFLPSLQNKVLQTVDKLPGIYIGNRHRIRRFNKRVHRRSGMYY